MTDQPGTITSRQRDYIVSLIDTRNLFASPKWFEAVNAMDEGEYAQTLTHLKTVTVPALSKAKASAYIGQLLSLPKKPAETIAPSTSTSGPWKVSRLSVSYDQGAEQFAYAMQRAKDGNDLIVPRGSYAIERSTLRFPGAFTNDMLFFSVWIDDAPLPDGNIKWTVRMYVSDERVKISRSLQYDVLDAIGADPAAAASRYGHEKKRCGICSRKLTNDESRARGIGPVCAEKWGW